MKKKIDEMSKEEQYREYLKAHSNSDALNAERKYLRDQEKRRVERSRYELNNKRRKKYRKNNPENNRIENNRAEKNSNFGFKRKIRRFFLIILVILISLAGIFFSLTKNFDRKDIGNRDYGINKVSERELKNYRNILILGSDARRTEGYDGSRTDAIVILSINKKNGDMKLISLMRDSYLSMRDYGDEGYVLSKATHAHAYGGAMNTVSMINRNLDLNIREYMLFNWQAVSDMVDALGGVDIEVTENEIEDINHYGRETAANVGSEFTEITSAGKQTLTGVQAATYCRIRKNSGGDVSRGDRYKKVIQAVIAKGIKNPIALNKASKEVFPNVRTNMSNGRMATLGIMLGRSKSKGSISWPNDYYGGLLSDGLWYAVPTTLESNVEWLYDKAFGISDHVPSKICREISQEISSSYSQ